MPVLGQETLLRQTVHSFPFPCCSALGMDLQHQIQSHYVFKKKSVYIFLLIFFRERLCFFSLSLFTLCCSDWTILLFHLLITDSFLCPSILVLNLSIELFIYVIIFFSSEVSIWFFISSTLIEAFYLFFFHLFQVCS